MLVIGWRITSQFWFAREKIIGRKTKMFVSAIILQSHCFPVPLCILRRFHGSGAPPPKRISHTAHIYMFIQYF